MNTLNVSKALKICSAVRSNSDGNNVLNDTEPSEPKECHLLVVQRNHRLFHFKKL